MTTDSPTPMAASGPSTQRPGVVVHLDEDGPAKPESVLRNVDNLLTDLGDRLQVCLIAHGPGVAVCLRDSDHAQYLQALIARGASVLVCENTMARQRIDPDTLARGVGTVSSGISELVQRQLEGWAYVRP